MAAEAVGPHSRPGALGQGATRDEQPSGPIEHVAGEGEVQRSVCGVDLALRQDADGSPVFGEECHIVHGILSTL
jgi:hypothetical protein